MTGGFGVFIQNGEFEAGEVTGVASFVGIPDLTLSTELTFRFNEFTEAALSSESVVLF